MFSLPKILSRAFSICKYEQAYVLVYEGLGSPIEVMEEKKTKY